MTIKYLISGNKVKHLKKELIRTGVSVYRLLSNTNDKTPLGLTSAIVSSWLEGKVKSASKDHLDFVSDQWAKHPTMPWYTPSPIELATLKNSLSIHADEIKEIFDNAECPDGFNRSTLTNLINGRTKRIRKPYFDYIKTQLEKLPLLPEEKRKVPFKSKNYNTLLMYRDKYGFLPGHIFKVAKTPPPKGFRSVTVSEWFSSKPAKVKFEYLEWLLSSLEELKDKTPPVHTTLPKPVQIKNRLYTELNEEVLKELRAYREIYGFLPSHILNTAKDAPKDLKPTDISRWLSGKVKKADTVHITFVLKSCRGLVN